MCLVHVPHSPPDDRYQVEATIAGGAAKIREELGQHTASKDADMDSKSHTGFVGFQGSHVTRHLNLW